MHGDVFSCSTAKSDEQCREQAKRMQRPEDRDALERLAQIWEKLADVRAHHPELELEATSHPHV